MASKKKKAEKEVKIEKAEGLFLKEQLLKAECFKNRKDIVNAVLSDGKRYSVNEVNKMVDVYMKGKVK